MPLEFLQSKMESTSSPKYTEYLFFFVTQGVNLGQPDDCPDHVYQVMRNCWHKDVSQRPAFPLIIAQLKQEAVSYDSAFDNVPESPVHDKQPLYLNIGDSHEVPESKYRKAMEDNCLNRTTDTSQCPCCSFSLLFL